LNGKNTRSGDYRIKCLLIVLVILVIVDGLITQFVVGSGLGREGNPFLKGIVGESVFIPIKALGAGLCAFIIWDIHKHWAKMALIATVCFIVIYTGIVFWNFGVWVYMRILV
jgi:hypothetical protein